MCERIGQVRASGGGERGASIVCFAYMRIRARVVPVRLTRGCRKAAVSGQDAGRGWRSREREEREQL